MCLRVKGVNMEERAKYLVDEKLRVNSARDIILFNGKG